MANLFAIPSENAIQTTLASSMAIDEVASITLSDDLSAKLADVSATRPGILVIDRIDANATATPTKREYIKFVSVSGTTISTLTRAMGGSVAQAHTAGAVVEFVLDADTVKSICDTILVEHDETGAHGAITATSVDIGSTIAITGVLDEDDMASDSAVKLATQQSIKAYVDANTVSFASLNAPEGFLINGKIVPSVASNNLTVALKGMDGNDPSASNPVYVRINNTVRTITGAVSTTIVAGTNWFNAGSSELATKEIDYFVYLGQKTSTGAFYLIPSRIPYATLESEVSDTATNEKFGYGADNLDAGDSIVNIGRFAATLSAGAGYTWSVPTFTASNLIQRPIYETRRLSWTPQYSAAGSLTYTSTSTTNAEYCIRGNSLDLAIYSTGTLGGTASGALHFTVPFSRIYTDISTDGYGTVSTGSGVMGFGQWASNSSTTTMAWYKYDNSNYATTGTAYIRGRARYLIA